MYGNYSLRSETGGICRAYTNGAISARIEGFETIFSRVFTNFGRTVKVAAAPHITAIRRAVYVAESRRLRTADLHRAKKRTGIRAVLSFLLSRTKYAVKTALRNLKRSVAWIKAHLLVATKKSLFAIVRLRIVQKIMRLSNSTVTWLLVDPRSSAVPSFGGRLIERRIPVVSALALRVYEYLLVMILAAQMTAGHTDNILRLARLLNLTFRPYIRNRRMPISFLYFQALFRCQQYHRITKEFAGDEILSHHYFNHILGVALLYSNQPSRAKHYLERAIAIHSEYSVDYRALGRAELLFDNTGEAGKWFKKSVDLSPNTVMAHQNYAGRYDIPNYKPQTWELESADSLLIYDNYCQLAEDFFLLGKYHESLKLYQRMVDQQKKLDQPLPRELAAKLARAYPQFDPKKPVRLLPYEWVTQFGHIGLLDSYIKMAQTGMYPDANYVLLAPKEMVANVEYLSYWDRWFTIVRDEGLVDELFAYQRFVGDNFMVYPGVAAAEYWTRAAARAHIDWAQQGRAPLIKVSQEHRDIGARTLARLGVPENAWYVSLHVREGGYHGETAGSIGSHRNASIEDYLPAIKLITDRGGYVIRLGDPSMRAAPKMDGLIDYALSSEKSAAADIFFCGTSRFVIGTTSGLTTACISFGTPLVLVNCISNDWQLWSGNTHFILKPVWDFRNKRVVPFAEAFVPPIQGYLINSQIMRRRGLEVIPNTPDEIADAVRYKLDVVDGLTTPPQDSEEPMRSYCAAIAANPAMFGAARPIPSFLEKRAELLELPEKQLPAERTSRVVTAQAS